MLCTNKDDIYKSYHEPFFSSTNFIMGGSMSVIYGMHLGGVWGFDCQLEELLLLDLLANSLII